MILACGCDTIWTSFFDRCAPCRERLSTEADILIKRDKERAGFAPDWTVSGNTYYFRGARADNPRHEGAPEYAGRRK